MAQVIWFKKSRGLATQFDPVRIPYDKNDGVGYLAEAYNIDFGFTGAAFRRKGFEYADVSGACHSFFWGGGDCVFVKDNGLYILAEDMSVTQIRSGISSKRYSFCQAGDAIVYMNGSHSGVIRNSTSYNYTKPPDVRTPDETRVYNDPPIGSIVKWFAGRIWIAKGNAIYYSEPYAPNLFRLATNYIALPASITMMLPTKAGIFVSTSSRIYFFAGVNPGQMIQTIAAHYPAIKGTDVEADGIAVNGGKFTQEPIHLFTTTNGICMVTQEGNLINLTHEVLTYPKALVGCAAYDGEKYVVSLDGDSENLTLCMSLNTVAVSQYANFNFDGMCKFNDAIVGGNSSGLFTLLTGDDDNGDIIPAHFRTGATSFGAENEKRLRRSFLTGRFSGRLKVSVSGDSKEDVDKEVTPYNTNLEVIHQEVQGGRDIRGKHLDMKVANVQGSDFTVSAIQALLIIKGSKTTEVI